MKRVLVENLGKQYIRKHNVQKSVKSFVIDFFKKNIKKEKFWALRNVNFHANEGETLGIIGPNGAGKSTLLSLIARTTQPTEGKVTINGRMSSLLELGAGFHPDLTGRENIYLNGSILGLKKKEIDEKFDAIVEFSGIKNFIDSPVKFYSSGMYVRLGFAIAVEVNPDILLMDEILAVGDEEFRKKSLAKVESFKQQGKTMLIVSHDLETIKRISDRILLLNKGNVVNLGDPQAVVDEYKNFSIYQKGNIIVKEFGTKEATIEKVVMKNHSNKETLEFQPGDPAVIEIHYSAKRKIKNPVFGFSISDSQGKNVVGTNTQLRGKKIDFIEGKGVIKIKIHSLNLLRGIYHLSIACHSEDHKIQYHRKENFLEFKMLFSGEYEGVVYMPVDFEMGE